MAPLAQIEHRGLAIWVLQMWPTLRASEVAGATNHRKTNTSFKKHKFRILSSSLFTSHVQSWDHARRSCTTRAINLAWYKISGFCYHFWASEFRSGMYHMLAEQDLVLLSIRQNKYIILFYTKFRARANFVGNSAPSIHPWLKFIHTQPYSIVGKSKNTKKPVHKIPKM